LESQCIKIIFGLDEKDIRFENNRCYFQYDIGNDWRDLLSKILVIDENERMSESDFFNHRLLIQYDVQIQLQNLYTSKQIIEKDLENQTKEMEMLKDQLKKSLNLNDSLKLEINNIKQKEKIIYHQESTKYPNFEDLRSILSIEVENKHLTIPNIEHIIRIISNREIEFAYPRDIIQNLKIIFAQCLKDWESIKNNSNDLDRSTKADILFQIISILSNNIYGKIDEAVEHLFAKQLKKLDISL